MRFVKLYILQHVKVMKLKKVTQILYKIVQEI